MKNVLMAQGTSPCLLERRSVAYLSSAYARVRLMTKPCVSHPVSTQVRNTDERTSKRYVRNAHP